MNKTILSFLSSAILAGGSAAVFAASPPDGSITFHNASNNNITAQVSSFGKVTLGKQETKGVSYSTLFQACSASPTHCRAQFFVNNVPAGYAVINVVLGKIVNMQFSSMKVLTSRSQNILRNVTIK